MSECTTANPLGNAPVGKLLRRFAVPSIIAMLVGSLYNIVDQFFIGQSVGPLGNAATNISFPLSISCVAIALLFGIGGASAFNISMGMSEKDPGEREKAGYYMGNALVMLVVTGVILCFITELFLDPLLRFFGSPDNVLELAKTYTRIVAFGFPFLILSTGGGHLIRADGRPRQTMICNLSGAVLNTFLDALFVFGFGWGIAGAAAATIIGQVFSAVLAVLYLSHCKTIKIQKKHLRLKGSYIVRVTSLGATPCTNQLAMMIVQIVMNKSLKYYGAQSAYGEAIPIACAGIITKVNQVFLSFIIGISQGLQPIASFNFGAGHYGRVKEAFRKAATIGFLLAFGAFLLFQFAPRQITSIFGDGTQEYYEFAISYFRIFLFFTFLNFLQPITSNFFTAIGQPRNGIFLSLTRQIIFLLPLLLLLPLIMGIDGIMYAGPVADLMAGVAAIVMLARELRKKQYNTTEITHQ
ncbi:MAG: MATE family efflux transporter [Lachnospiraceae bacterium]|nr:MATE family efflux transporter [Lachnospiraceae bacterium]